MNLNIEHGKYLVVTEWETKKDNRQHSLDVWNNSNAKTTLSKNKVVTYKGISKNSIVFLYEVTSFDEIQRFLESDEFDEFRNANSQFMDSDFHQSIVGKVEEVRPRNTFVPQTKYMQLRSIEVPFSDIDSYLAWRKERIFKFVKKNDKVDSFLAFHSVFSTEPGVLFVTEYSGDPEEYRNSFLTPEYQQIIKEAGHDHIKSGEKGLMTFEYERAE